MEVHTVGYHYAFEDYQAAEGIEQRAKKAGIKHHRRSGGTDLEINCY